MGKVIEFYYKFQLYPKYFQRIEENKKNIEIRLYRDRYVDIAKEFKNRNSPIQIIFEKLDSLENKKIYAEITDINVYTSYSEMCTDFSETTSYPPNHTGVTEKELKKIYSEEIQNTYGLIAFKFKRTSFIKETNYKNL